MTEVKKTTSTKATTTAPKAPVASKSVAPKATTASTKTTVETATKIEVAPVVVKKAAAKKIVGKQIKITLIKSANSANKKQKRTVEALGLSRPNSFKIQPDNGAIRGMIFAIKHMLKIEEVK